MSTQYSIDSFFFNGFSVANNSNGNKSFLRSFFFSLLFALYLCFTDVVAYYKFHVFFNYCIGFNSAGSSGQKTWKNRVCQRWGVQMHSKTTINILFVEWSFNFMIIIIWLMPLSDFSLLLIKHSNTNIANTIIACCRGWLNENIVIENAHVTFHSQIGWSFSCTLFEIGENALKSGKCFEIENTLKIGDAPKKWVDNRNYSMNFPPKSIANAQNWFKIIEKSHRID